jgi:hypothetical protein
MRNFKLTILFFLVFLSISNLLFGQTKKRNTTKKTTTKQTVTLVPTPTVTQPVEEKPTKIEAKKNERPTNEAQKTNQNTKTSNSVYFYEFAQPQFDVTKISIEHDEQGNGQITFMKQNFEEAVSDPIQISAASLEKIKTAFQALNFLDSTENYQDVQRDYKHLGEIKIKVKKNGRERTAQFNWTGNENAKFLMDEYRRIAQQFVWIFDINVARQNQPLQSPGLFDVLDGYLKRNEISDPSQMIPILKKLSEDERIPLIGRNHATRLIKEIEKKTEKENAK